MVSLLVGHCWKEWWCSQVFYYFCTLQLLGGFSSACASSRFLAPFQNGSINFPDGTWSHPENGTHAKIRVARCPRFVPESRPSRLHEPGLKMRRSWRSLMTFWTNFVGVLERASFGFTSSGGRNKQQATETECFLKRFCLLHFTPFELKLNKLENCHHW